MEFLIEDLCLQHTEEYLLEKRPKSPLMLLKIVPLRRNMI